MDYKIKTNVVELNLIENEYFEILPGIFQNKFWSDDSIFISRDIYDVIMDIASGIYKIFSNKEKNNDFTYLSANEVDKFEKYIIKKIDKIANNKYLSDNEYIKDKICKYKNEIIEMLYNFIYWIKSNNENGLTIILKLMDHKILTINDLSKNSVYLEYMQGQFINEYYKESSIFIGSGENQVLEDLLYNLNNNYERNGYNFYYYNKELIYKLMHELENRINLIKNNIKITGNYNQSNFDERKYYGNNYYFKNYYSTINKTINSYKYEVVKMLEDLNKWLKSNNNEGITVIGKKALNNTRIQGRRAIKS